MKLKKDQLSVILLIIYLSLFTLFIGKTIFNLNKRAAFSGNSSLPILSTGQLEKISKELATREKLIYPEKMDLSKFQFGKLEPFNP